MEDQVKFHCPQNISGASDQQKWRCSSLRKPGDVKLIWKEDIYILEVDVAGSLVTLLARQLQWGGE